MSSLTARKPPPDETWKQAQKIASRSVPTDVVGSPRTANGAATVASRGVNEAEVSPAPGYAAPWPPAPPPWVDDRATQRCMGRACTVAFDSIIERRHHCRLCGNVFCGACSARNAMLPPEWNIKEPQRVCNACFRVVLPYQATWVRQNANAERENLLDDDATTRYMNSPLRFTLGGEIRKAAYSLHNLTDATNVNFWERDAEYTTELLEAVEGLLFMTVGKIAFIGGLRVATGCLVARLSDGTWSAPCAVGSFGITFGACVGAEITDMVTGIDKESMVKFANDQVSNIMLGGEASFAIGPFGRTASGEVHVPAMGPASHSEAYMSYSQSRGAFGGVTVEAAYVKVRDDVNEKFYGYAVKAHQILDGTVPRPKAAEPLYAAIYQFYAQVFPDGAPGRAIAAPVVGSTGLDDGTGPSRRAEPTLERYRPTAKNRTAKPAPPAPPPPPPKAAPFGHFSAATPPAPPAPPQASARVDHDDDDFSAQQAGFFEPRLVDGPFGESAEL